MHKEDQEQKEFALLSRRNLVKYGLGATALVAGGGFAALKSGLFVPAGGAVHASQAVVAGEQDSKELIDLVNSTIVGPANTDQASAELAKQAALSAGEKAVRLALTQKGYHENPPNSNHNKFSAYWGHGAEPWCADFVSWAFDYPNHRNKRVPWGWPSAVAGIISWGRKGHHMVSTPRRGDIFAIHNSRASHTGLVVSVDTRRGTFTTIEGNTSRPGSSGIQWVWSHTRRIRDYVFIRVPSDS